MYQCGCSEVFDTQCLSPNTTISSLQSHLLQKRHIVHISALHRMDRTCEDDVEGILEKKGDEVTHERGLGGDGVSMFAHCSESSSNFNEAPVLPALLIGVLAARFGRVSTRRTLILGDASIASIPRFKPASAQKVSLSSRTHYTIQHHHEKMPCSIFMCP